MGMLLCVYGAGFLLVFKACPVLDTGAQQQAHSTGKCKCRLRQEPVATIAALHTVAAKLPRPAYAQNTWMC